MTILLNTSVLFNQDSVEHDRQACDRATEQFFRPNADSTMQRSGAPNDNPVCSTTKLLCTPLLASVVCQLLVNLLHHLPKFIPAELMRLRVHSLLMNIVDPSTFMSCGVVKGCHNALVHSMRIAFYISSLASL